MIGRQMEGGAPDPSPLWIKFPDGGSYVGPVSSGLAHGLGVTVGARGVGEFSGLYQAGYESLGVLKTAAATTNGQTKVREDSPVDSYYGEWSDGRRHGLGVDSREGWIYKGEWTQGFRGRYGVRHKADTSVGYEGTWTSGVQDGFGVETYVDGSWYCGQWMKGMRHGYGVRQSSTYQSASKCRSTSQHPLQSTMSQSKKSALLSNPADNLVALRDQKVLSGRGGFVLLADTSLPALPRKRGLLLDRHGRPSLSKTISHQFRLKELTSTGSFSRSSSIRSVGSRKYGGSVRSAAVTQDDLHCYTDDDTASFISQDFTSNTVPLTALKEVYLGEWKDDRRNGYGVCRRSDGLTYEGEWLNNQKNGYGCTTLPNGTKLIGKYRNNVLITSTSTKSVLAPFRGNKINDRTMFAVEESQRAAKYAKEKEEIARIRMKGARERAVLAEGAAARAAVEAEAARTQAARYISANQSTSEVDIAMHRPSEREFYMEIDPTDTDFSFTGSQSVKKKRFPLPIGRSRTGSLSASDDPGSGLTDFVSNQRNATKLRPQSHFDTFENSEFDNEPTLIRSRFQPSHAENVTSVLKPAQQPPTYTFEETPQPTVNRLSSVPAYNHYSEYEPTVLGRTRRKSLPSIVKEKIVEEASPEVLFDSNIDPDLPAMKKSISVTPQGQTTHTVQIPPRKQTVKRIDTYIIENGVRKLVKKTRESPVAGRRDAGSGIKAGGALSSLIRSSFNAASAAPRAHVSLEEQFNDMYKTESPDSGWKKGRGSIPDIATAVGIKIPAREEVYVLSQRRREEIIQERAQRERIRKNHIVLSFIDTKRWFAEHILLVIFIFINALLAVVLTKS